LGIVTSSETHRAIDAVWRIESAKLIAGLTRIVHDVGVAEDLAQDALLVALEKWPQSGVPDNPGAWLMATAKHRATTMSATISSASFSYRAIRFSRPRRALR
jgi:predicted RNA polymerase sigma factor